MYIDIPLCRYCITVYRYVLVLIVAHVDIEIQENKQFFSNIPCINLNSHSFAVMQLKNILHLTKAFYTTCVPGSSPVLYYWTRAVWLCKTPRPSSTYKISSDHVTKICIKCWNILSYSTPMYFMWTCIRQVIFTDQVHVHCRLFFWSYCRHHNSFGIIIQHIYLWRFTIFH